MCNGCYKCRHLFSVLTSGPMTVSAQRGICHMRTGCRGPEVKTQKCMHKYYARYFGTGTIRHQDTSAPVRDISAPV
jgi:hypothetical protein